MENKNKIIIGIITKLSLWNFFFTKSNTENTRKIIINGKIRKLPHMLPQLSLGRTKRVTIRIMSIKKENFAEIVIDFIDINIFYQKTAHMAISWF